MSDTFFTASPEWGWYIVAYFFVGGVAGGCFFIASLLQLAGRPEDGPVIRLGHYVAFGGALVSGVLLTLDLTRPERFWHMLIASNTGDLMFKAWSPMSVGAWGLLLFSAAATVALAGSLAETGTLSWAPLRGLARGLPATLVAIAGSTLGFFLAGYTGVLLAVTNRPLWADSPFLGALFLCSAASTGAAALMLLGMRWPQVHPATIGWLTRFDRAALWLELVALGAFVASLGSVARVLVGWWGLALTLGVAGLGVVAPLAMSYRVHQPGTVVRAATLVLSGGLLLRMVVILSSNQIHAAGSGVALP
ncbi:MAG TPA: NrfD/PsrC family molybdoenzyme membrane anchor subunit [Gemmatimonadales bacterium]|nr:NrfD/PsrC family molybdoenzyme membrane anchor subunit [Gemmatimonadales bacterium]